MYLNPESFIGRYASGTSNTEGQFFARSTNSSANAYRVYVVPVVPSCIAWDLFISGFHIKSKEKAPLSLRNQAMRWWSRTV